MPWSIVTKFYQDSIKTVWLWEWTSLILSIWKPDSVELITLLFKLLCKTRYPVQMTWYINMELCSSLYFFREFKTALERSTYLNQLHNVKYIHILAKLRLSSHKLNIEMGRHNQIDRQDRKCIRCNSNDIEDEFHFV